LQWQPQIDVASVSCVTSRFLAWVFYCSGVSSELFRVLLLIFFLKVSCSAFLIDAVGFEGKLVARSDHD
jgi:hypothetical protein